MAKKVTQAGDLDRVGDLLTLNTHLNTRGEIEAQSYGPYRQNIPCNKQDNGGSENPISDRETALNETVFTIRYDANVNAKMRWVFEGSEYDIINVGEGENRRQFTVLTTKKRD